MSGIFDHMHFKRNTAGSSNELSFDVLEAAKNELDGKKERTSKNASLPKASQGNYHGVKGTSTLSGQAEVEKRKRARRSHRIRTGIIAAVVGVLAVAAIALGAWYFAPQYAQYVQDSQAPNQKVSDVVAQLVEIDSYMAKVDDVMEDPLSEQSKEQYVEILAYMEVTQKDLAKLREEVGKTLQGSLSENDRAALEQLDSALEARSSMLTAAQEELKLASKVDSEVDRANKDWGAVIEADQLARQATQQANTAVTEEETQAARDLTQQALDQFTTALNDLQAVADRHQGIDLASQLAYLKIKVEAVNHAVATSDALLAADRATAMAENEAYNETDAKAAALAEELPASVEDAVRSAYAKELAIYAAKYQSSRDQAISADAAVRSYLNTDPSE